MPRRNTLNKPMRQARAMADELLALFEELTSSRLGEDAVAALRQYTGWPIISLAELRRAREAIKLPAVQACRQLKPERALPALVDTISRHYSKTLSRTSHVTWLGPALKMCMGLTWPNIHCASGLTCTARALRTAVGRCAAYQILLWLEYLVELTSSSETYIGLTVDGIALSPALARAQAATSLLGSARLRGPDAGAALLISDPEGTKTAISEVMHGADPRTITHFQGTALSFLRPGEGKPLWSYLWMMMETAYTVALGSRLLYGNVEGVVLIPHPMLINLPTPSADLAASVSNLVFWRKDWYESLDEQSLLNAVVERPVIRCDRNGNFYATCLIFVLDALAWGLESAFFWYPRMQELWLLADVRQIAFANPLEESAIQVCRRLRYRAGHVTSSGSWQTADGIEYLASRTGEPCPGEIDCLAVSEQGDVVVLECKVLNLPLTIGTLRNVVRKLGPDDTEGFHTKLRQKVQWIRTVLGVQAVHAAIVVDRLPPLLEAGLEHAVIPADHLADWL
jgi:hypothetical protein